MKKIISFLVIGFLAVACESNQDTEIITLPDGVSFQIEKTNSNNNYVSNSNSSTLNSKSSYWSKGHHYPDITLDNLDYISKGILFDTTLENGETVKIRFTFIKSNPDKNLLILDGTNSWGSNWNYISSQTEIVDFYKNCELRVEIGEAGENVIFLGNTSTNDQVTVETVLINGEEKSHVSINFAGSARGWYDPNGEYLEVYNITNGVFRGIVE